MQKTRHKNSVKMFIFGVCFVLHLIKLSAEKDIVYPGYIQGNCMFCNVTVLIGREVNIDIFMFWMTNFI